VTLKQNKKNQKDQAGEILIKRPELGENLPFKETIPELVQIILNSIENKNVVQKIYLFGSYAYGKPTKESDLDICVILDNVEERTEIYIEIGVALFDKDIINCDLLVYKEKEFYNAKNPKSVEHTIMRKGWLLYER